MKPRRFYKPVIDPLASKYRRNNQITASSLLVIDQDGEKLGEMPLSQALELAYNQELDLVELSPNAKPPVAKIISWSKFKYEQGKKLKASKSKTQEQKEIWFKAFIGEGDLQHKLKKVAEFLEKKHTVKMTIRARGRVPREAVTELMKKLLERTAEFGAPVGPPKFEGYNFSVILAVKK